MAAPRSKVVGTHDRGPALNRAPSANMIGRREVRYAALSIVIDEAGETSNFAETSFVEQKTDAFTAGQLASATLAHHAWVLGVWRETLAGLLLQRPHFRKHRCPGVLAMGSRSASCDLIRPRLDCRENLPRHDHIARIVHANTGHYARYGCGERCLHFHRA